MNLGLLQATLPGVPPPPEQLPIGRAALALAAEGVCLIFGEHAENGELHGHRAVPGGWRPVRAPLHAAIDRYGSFTNPDHYHALLHGLGGVPVHNPPALTALLRDKLATQILLHPLDLPAMEVRPDRFEAALERWGAGFHKPRFGSFGRGVRRLTTGPAPARDIVDRVDQPFLLQRAVPPPEGWAGVSLRILVQQEDGIAVARTPVARVSREDAVVNRARGADVLPLVDLFPGSVQPAVDLAIQAFNALPGAVEVGVDLVLDPELVPHIIELNARPRGRLASLAAADPGRFEAEHQQAVLAPFLHALRA